jgi:HEAT repeat protein
LDALNTPQRASGGRWFLLAFAACVGAGGCQTWDEVTSRDFTVKGMFSHPDPIYVLNNSQDGDKRERALRSLREPIRNGGTQKDQDAVVTVLVYTASNDPQMLCRQAAVCALRGFKDPRAVEGLKNAYYRAESFPPETATTLRIQVLSALGEVADPAAIDLLVKVLHEPEVKFPEADRQQSLDLHIAAARALGHLRTKESVEALVDVLKSNQEALQVPAHEALVAASGRHLPPDPQAWDDLLQKAKKDGTEVVVEPSFTDRVLDVLPVAFWK